MIYEHNNNIFLGVSGGHWYLDGWCRYILLGLEQVQPQELNGAEKDYDFFYHIMRTKIIATIGPASDSAEMIQKFVDAGMDIARVNFSHCTDENFLKYKKRLAAAGRKAGRKIPIMQDLQGPRIRVGELPAEGYKLIEGETVIFSTNKADAQKNAPHVIFVDSPKLHADMRVGELIYLANGDMELVVTRIVGNRITARVARGGTLYSRKGVNLPNTKLSNSGLTKKDIRDVKFGLAHGVKDIRDLVRAGCERYRGVA